MQNKNPVHVVKAIAAGELRVQVTPDGKNIEIMIVREGRWLSLQFTPGKIDRFSAVLDEVATAIHEGDVEKC